MLKEKKTLLIFDVILGLADFTLASVLMARFVILRMNGESISPLVADCIMFVAMLLTTATFALINMHYVFFISSRLHKAQEMALKANRAKNIFLNNMSHDFRTPMNAIIGFSNLAKERLDDRKIVEDYLNKILISSDNLLMILNNVLNMSRLESGKMELDEQYWTRNQIFEPVYLAYSEEANKKNINFSFGRTSVHNGIYCDRIRIQLILMNIIGNAVKYTPEGGTVRVLLEELPHEKPGWCYNKVTVQDNGIGISPEFLPHIFDDFEREESTPCGMPGTGLGLSITKGLVELMGGTISIQSKKDKGTVVTTRIPHQVVHIQEEDPELAHSRESLSREAEKADFKGKKLLLVEDNELNREIAMTVLEETGFVMSCATNGLEAVEMVEKNPAGTFDLILMDISMPVMNGYDATVRIRHMEDLEKSNIPIIAMTANAFEEDKKMALGYGMNAHISKPLNVKDLLSVLSDYLS